MTPQKGQDSLQLPLPWPLWRMPNWSLLLPLQWRMIIGMRPEARSYRYTKGGYRALFGGNLCWRPPNNEVINFFHLVIALHFQHLTLVLNTWLAVRIIRYLEITEQEVCLATRATKNNSILVYAKLGCLQNYALYHVVTLTSILGLFAGLTFQLYSLMGV